MGQLSAKLAALSRKRVHPQSAAWSHPAPAGADVSLESDEVYICIGENMLSVCKPRVSFQRWSWEFVIILSIHALLTYCGVDTIIH